MNKSSAGNLALFFASVLMCLVLLEFVLRLYLPEDMDTTWNMRIPHPEYGWSLRPDASYHYRMATDMVQVEHNTRGYRDREHSFENPAGIPRVVVLGDSFMESFSVDSEKAFYSQLEKELAGAGEVVEVINLGVGGYGTLQEYLVYMEEGRRYRPDIVLLGFFIGNDLRNNSRELETIVNAGSMKVDSRPFLKHINDGELVTTQIDYEGAMQRFRQAQPVQDTLFNRLAGKFAVLRAIDLALSRFGPGVAKIPVELEEKQDFAGLGMHYCDEPEEFTRAWEITRQLLAQLNSKVRADGATLYIFTVTAEHEVNAGAMDRIVAGFHMQEAMCLEDAPAYRRLASIASELEIGHVDLLSAFRQRALAGEHFFLADRHWNAAGHALAARIVAGVLLQKRPLSSKD